MFHTVRRMTVSDLLVQATPLPKSFRSKARPCSTEAASLSDRRLTTIFDESGWSLRGECGMRERKPRTDFARLTYSSTKML